MPNWGLSVIPVFFNIHISPGCSLANMLCHASGHFLSKFYVFIIIALERTNLAH